MNRKGFTLIEIIISITLIVLISTISIVYFTKDNSKEAIEREEQIVSAANVYTSSNSIIDIDVLKETGRTFITVGELIKNGYLTDDLLKTKDKLGNEITEDSKVAVYLVDDVDLLYFDFNGDIESSLVIIKEDKTLTYSKNTSIKVKDVVYNEFLRAYDSNNNDIKNNVTFEVKDSNDNIIYTEEDLDENFDTRYIKNYTVHYSYEDLTEILTIKITGKYDVDLEITHTNNPSGSFNPGETVNLTIVPKTNYIYDSSNFTCKDVNTGNSISKSISNNKLTINNINTDIKCTGAYKENVRYITLNITNASVKNVSGGTLQTNKVKVAYGNSVSITFTPKSSNYTKYTVKCGSSTKYLSNNVLSLNNITSNTTCNITYSIPTYTFYLNVSNGTYNGKSTTSMTLEKGSDLELNITPNNNSVFDYYSCSSGVTFDLTTNKLVLNNIDSYKSCYIYYIEDNLYNRVRRKIYNYDDPIYIKYGEHKWIVYDYTYDDNYNALGVKMILDRTAGTTSFSSTACCDTGVCTYANNNFINNYIGKTVLTNFYNKLPKSKSEVLIENNYNTGYYTLNNNWTVKEDYTSDRTATSIIGMLEDDDSYIVQHYKPFYENSENQLTWTTILGYQGTTTYGRLVVRFKNAVYDYNAWDVYELVNTSYFPYSYFNSASGRVSPPNKNYYYRPVIVMDKNTKVKSGTGTKTDPYVVE